MSRCERDQACHPERSEGSGWPHAGICCRLFLGVQGIQAGVAVEINVESYGRKLVAGEQAGVIRVVGKILLKLGDVILARHSSRRRRCFPLGQQGTKERTEGIVLDVELDAELSKVVLDDGLNFSALGAAGD